MARPDLHGSLGRAASFKENILDRSTILAVALFATLVNLLIMDHRLTKMEARVHVLECGIKSAPTPECSK